MMFLIRCLVYSVNYLVCLLITARTNQVRDIKNIVWDVWFTLFSRAPPLESGGY